MIKKLSLIPLTLLLTLGISNATEHNSSIVESNTSIIVAGYYDSDDGYQVCEPGEYECQSGHRMRCSYNGKEWRDTYSSCGNQICQPGEKQCFAGQTMGLCSSDGTKWITYPAPVSCR